MTTVRLDEYAVLSQEILDLVQDAADRVLPVFRAGQTLTLRLSAMAGLWRKAYLAFESLVHDAKRGRAESMHHLKTMTECFLWLRYVDREQDDRGAKTLLTEAARQKKNFFKSYPEFPNQDTYFKMYSGRHENLSREIGKTMAKLEDIADKDISIYNRIFRNACEEAHITDILNYMPGPGGEIDLGPPKTSVLFALVAFQQGTFLMCELLKALSAFYGLGLEERIMSIKSNLELLNKKQTIDG